MNTANITAQFNRKNILNILSAHQNNIDKKAINALFSSVRLKSDGAQLIISSMDGERFLEHRMETKLPVFDMFLPGFSLHELLRKSNQEMFEITEAEKQYVIKMGHGEFKFAKFHNKDWPEWVDGHSHIIELDSQQLCQALKVVRWAASYDDARPFLNGVCIDVQEALNICATDGLRLALKTLPNKTDIRDTWIMGRKSINDLVKLLEEAVGNVKLNLGKNACVEMKTEDAQVIWKTLLIAGKFPQYTKIIPTSSTASLVIDTKDFIDIIERMMIFANSNQPIITLQLGSACNIFAESALASGTHDLECAYTGPEMKISFNARLLLEMLNNLSGKLSFAINNPHSPVLIKGEIEDALFILAPVKRD